MLNTLFFTRASWLVVVFIIGVGVSQVSEAETKPLFGVKMILADADFNGLASSTASGYGVVLGVTAESFRVYGDLNFYAWEGADTRTIHANYDYIWRAGESWQVFMGIYGGLVDLELDVADKYQSGASVGVQAGFLIPLGSSGWQVETGLRYGGFDAQLFDPETQQAIKIKTQSEAFITLNYSS